MWRHSWGAGREIGLTQPEAQYRLQYQIQTRDALAKALYLVLCFVGSFPENVQSNRPDIPIAFSFSLDPWDLDHDGHVVAEG